MLYLTHKAEVRSKKMNKNIVFTAPQVVEVIDRPVPVVKENHVLVKTEYTCISSGTERSNLLGNANVSIASKEKNEKAVFPRQSGYSASGTVEAVGEGVTNFKVGDRVSCSWSVHAQYFTVPENQVYLIPDGVSMQNAAFSHLAIFPLAAIRKVGLEAGESAIVMGMGILGLTAIKLLKASGAVPIIAVDPMKEKREKAISLGADYALDPFDPDFEKTVKSVTNGGVKCAIEVTGNGKALDQVLDCMAKFGRVALLGCTRNSDFTIDYYRKVHGPGITMVGAHTLARPALESSHGWWTQKDDAECILRMLKYGRINFMDMVDEVHSPDDAHKVYERLANESAFPIVQFDWNKL